MPSGTRSFKLPLLAALGRNVFGKRLFVGLAVAVVGLPFLDPKPLFHGTYGFVQALGVVVILGGLGLRAWGGGSAGPHTRSAAIEAPRLVTGGPFAYVRNPIYLGSIGLGLGMSALIGDPLALVLSAIAFAILYFTIVPAEEELLRRRFGATYEQYRRAVPRLIPRLRPWPQRSCLPFQWRAALGELHIALVVAAIYLALLAVEYRDRWSAAG